MSRQPGEKRAHWPAPLDLLTDADGQPPCADPDGCPVCRLLERPRPGETWRQWYERVSQGR